MAFKFYEMGTEAQRPQAKIRDWMKDKVMELVTVDTLERVIDECIASGRYAIDLETTGLDNRVFDGRTKDHIVGVCLSPDGKHGYYAPVRHKKGTEHNLPVTKMEKELRRLVASESIAVFHNGKFDQEFLQFAGGEPIGLWDDPKKWEDTLILAWLRNTRDKKKGLKWLSKQELGYEMIELKELFPPDYKGPMDFSLLDPSEEAVVFYGASDAICTYCLFDILMPQVIAPGGDKRKGQAVIYNLEKMTVPATRWLERCRVMIDQNKVAELMQLGQQEYLDCLSEVYDFCSEALGRNIEPGWFQVFRKKVVVEDVDHNINEQIDEARLEAKREMLDALDAKGHFIKIEKEIEGEKKLFPEKYDILSRPQLGPLFEELEIPDLHRTEKSKQVQTTQSEIDRLNDMYGSKYPFLPKIKRMGELQKALGTYLISLRNDVGPDGTLKVNYQQLGTDTGRYTTPSSKRPEEDGGTKFPMHGTPATYDKKRPQCLLRVREAIVPREGKILGALDFGGVELRIATNLSGEPKWLKEFFRCSSCGQEFDSGDGEITPEAPPAYCPRCGDDRIGDLHTLTGVAFFGESQVGTKNWKMLRGQAKSSNFALAYGGGPGALVRAAGIPEQDAARHHRTFSGTYIGLKGWWDSVKAFGRRHGYVLTALGRQYPIPDIQLPTSHKECPDPRQREFNRKFKAKAERNATNGPIQGCLHPDVRIPTSEGMLTVKELWDLQENGDLHTFKVWTGKTWEDGRALYSGWKDLVTTEFDSGQTIKTSPEHLFRVYHKGSFKWIPQAELTPDMWVATNASPVQGLDPVAYSYDSHTFEQDGKTYEHRHFPGNRKQFAFEGNQSLLWEFLGSVYGDGSISADSFILHIGESPEHMGEEWKGAQEIAETLVVQLNERLGVEAIARLNRRQDGDSRRPTWQVKIHNKSFREFCRDALGVEDQTTHTKRFPKAIWRESFENRAAFLRGYFTADGCINNACAIDVRSVNDGLLADTHQLLRTLGIRSTLRIGSHRVSVKDRLAFRKYIGFLRDYKQIRLAEMAPNAYFDQWHKCPADLVERVGHCVRESSLWEDLTKGEKAAVFRLMAGSGSKTQTLRYLNRVPDGEVPEALRTALAYDYESVVDVEHAAAQVEMYDIEVFDDKHAFVADGFIVHNTSADLTKLAMALIYREVKKREWFEKVYMIITIHDELVFEIDKDIVAEALEIFQEVMTRNKTVMRLKWRVPLTTDCEIGFDWTVPWDTKDFKFRRVRRDGVQVNEKGEPTSKVWPPDLVAIFGARYGYHDEAPPEGQEPPQTAADAALDAIAADLPSASETLPLAAARAPLAPSLGKGEHYDYHLRRWGVGVAEQLAQVIVKCRGRGTHPLRVFSPTGDNALWDNASIMVSPIEFETVAKIHGI